MSKLFKNKKSFKNCLKYGLTTLQLVALLTTSTACSIYSDTYSIENSNLDADNVINNITIFGGDLRYIDQSYNILSGEKNTIVSHLKEKNGAYFVIPSNTKVLYVYRLKVSDIEKEINEKNKNI